MLFTPGEMAVDESHGCDSSVGGHENAPPGADPDGASDVEGRGYRQRVAMMRPMNASPPPIARFHAPMSGIGYCELDR